MNQDTVRLRLIKRLTLICAFLLLATVTLSAFMRLTQAGLGCDNWPACYGAQFRAASADAGPSPISEPAVVAARLAHRIVATLALVLIITIVMMSRTHPQVSRGQRTLAIALLALSLGLAVLGVATPGARTPAISMGNLLGGFLVLALCWRLATSIGVPHQASARAGLGALAPVGVVILLLQLASGALLSTSFASLACSGLADCQRAAAEAGWPWSALSPWQEPSFLASAPQVNADGAVAQWVHRLGSIVGAVALALLGLLSIRRGHVRAGVILIGLTLAQVLLGLFALSGGLPLWAAMLHNLVAALLLLTLIRVA